MRLNTIQRNYLQRSRGHKKDLTHCGWLKIVQDYELSFPVGFPVIANADKDREMLPWMEHDCFNV